MQVSLTSTPVGGEWSASRPESFTPTEKAPGTHWRGVGPRTSLEEAEKRKLLTLPGLKLLLFGRSTRSQSIYNIQHLFFV
jgi:hypothetical protein